MARSLGISLQPDGCSFALLDGSAKKPVLKAWGSVALELNSRDGAKALGKALARALKSAGVGKTDHQVLSVPSTEAVLRELALPFTERDKVRQVLKFEVESDLYHLDIDDVICDFVDLHDQRATSSILVSAVPKSHLETGLDVAEAAGFDPPEVELDLGALLALLETQSAPPAPGELDAYLHFGPSHSLLLVRDSEGLRAVRAMPLGWRELGRGLEDADEGIEAEGEAVLAAVEQTGIGAEDELETAPGGAEGEEGETDAAPAGPARFLGGDPALPVRLSYAEVLERGRPETRAALIRRVVGEVRRGLAAVSSSPVARLHLLGANPPGFEEALETRLGVPTAALYGEGLLGADPAAGGGESAASVGGSADPVAVGAALRGLGVGSSQMNFRQEEFRFASGFERIEGPVTFAMFGLLAWLLVSAVIDYKKLQVVSGDVEGLIAYAERKIDQYNEGLGEDQKQDWTVRTDTGTLEPLRRLPSLASRMTRKQEELHELVGEAGVEMPQSCTDAWRLLVFELDGRMKTYGDRWMAESFRFVAQSSRRNETAHVLATLGLTLFGEALESTRAFEELKNGLEELPWILSVENSDGFAAVKETPGARFGTLQIKIDVDKAREAGA
ncbi:MAG TPA: hypothetical protein VGC54_13690 [Planctomycetota bacterium]